MSEASTQFMVGRLSTESDKCNRFNLDGIFGNDKGQSAPFRSTLTMRSFLQKSGENL